MAAIPTNSSGTTSSAQDNQTLFNTTAQDIHTQDSTIENVGITFATTSLPEDCCSVCRDVVNNPTITPCAHVYCLSCLESALPRQPNHCPICQQSLTSVINNVWPTIPAYAERFERTIRLYRVAQKPLFYIHNGKQVLDLINNDWINILAPRQKQEQPPVPQPLPRIPEPPVLPAPQGKWKSCVEGLKAAMWVIGELLAPWLCLGAIFLFFGWVNKLTKTDGATVWYEIPGRRGGRSSRA